MTSRSMSPERLRALLEAYGANFERWPEDEVEAARTLLELSEPLRALVREQAELDRYLSELDLSALPPELERRLLAIPERSPRARPSWPFSSLWAPAVGWAAAAVLGLLLGVLSAEEEAREAAAQLEDSELVALSTGAFSELEEGP
jgi:hypothetical protein